MRVIGITGKAGAGKTTTGRMLRVMMGSGVVMHAGFAQALKIKARQEFGWNGEKDEEGRKLLQRIGQSHRDIDPNYWIDELKRNLTYATLAIINAGEDFEALVIDDVRYLNEAEWIKRGGGIIIRVLSNDGHDLGDMGKHSSEVEQEKIVADFTIGNPHTGLHCLMATIEDLWPEIEEACNEALNEAAEEYAATATEIWPALDPRDDPSVG